MKNIKKIFAIFILVCTLPFVTACFGKSDVKTVIVPEDAQKNLYNGKYTNSSDNSVWQFNANGTLLIINESGGEGEYDIVYKDSSMYLTNVDGVSIQFYYTEHDDGTIDVTINGKNADTSTLTPMDNKE